MAFDQEPFPTEAVQFVAPSHRVRRAVHYMAAMGLWRPQCMQEMSLSNGKKLLMLCFPSRGGTGVVNILCFLCIFCHPIRFVLLRRLRRLYVIMNIPVTPWVLMCNCCNVASLQWILVGWVFLLGDSGVCIYVSGRVVAF